MLQRSTCRRPSRGCYPRDVPRRPKRPYHHGDLPRALCDAALQLIEERGTASLTLSEVARRVGVSHAAPYRHFADKGALMTALSAEGAHLLADRVGAALAAAGSDPRTRFLDAGYAYVRFAVDNPGYFQAMFSSECDREDPTAVAARERSLGLLYAYIEDAQSSGFLREAALIDVVVPVFAMHQGLAALAASGALGPLGVTDLRTASDVAHASLLDGLVPTPRAV